MLLCSLGLNSTLSISVISFSWLGPYLTKGRIVFADWSSTTDDLNNATENNVIDIDPIISKANGGFQGIGIRYAEVEGKPYLITMGGKQNKYINTWALTKKPLGASYKWVISDEPVYTVTKINEGNTINNIDTITLSDYLVEGVPEKGSIFTKTLVIAYTVDYYGEGISIFELNDAGKLSLVSQNAKVDGNESQRSWGMNTIIGTMEGELGIYYTTLWNNVHETLKFVPFKIIDKNLTVSKALLLAETEFSESFVWNALMQWEITESNELLMVGQAGSQWNVGTLKITPQSSQLKSAVKIPSEGSASTIGPAWAQNSMMRPEVIVLGSPYSIYNSKVHDKLTTTVAATMAATMAATITNSNESTTTTGYTDTTGNDKSFSASAISDIDFGSIGQLNSSLTFTY